jgi:hypothetical protein
LEEIKTTRLVSSYIHKNEFLELGAYYKIIPASKKFDSGQEGTMMKEKITILILLIITLIFQVYILFFVFNETTLYAVNNWYGPPNFVLSIMILLGVVMLIINSIINLDNKR